MGKERTTTVVLSPNDYCKLALLSSSSTGSDDLLGYKQELIRPSKSSRDRLNVLDPNPLSSSFSPQLSSR